MAQHSNDIANGPTDAVITNTTREGSPQKAVLPQSMTPEEIALYDRQIRLWGVKAQERLRNAKVVLITVRGVGAEIAKNLTLAGIQTLNLIDGAPVTVDDLRANFLLDRTSIGLNRAQASAPFLRDMNPRVTITADPRPLEQIPSLDAILSIFDLVIATDLPFPTTSRVAAAARAVRKPFYAAESIGFFGYAFADLISHDFAVERQASNVAVEPGTRETPTRTVLGARQEQTKGRPGNGNVSGAGPAKETVTKREVYQPLSSIAFAELPPSESSARRKLRITPLLSCVRALWLFQSQNPSNHPFPRIPNPEVTGPGRSISTADGEASAQAKAEAEPGSEASPASGVENLNEGNPEAETFLALARQQHALLGLPAHTLSADKVADFLFCCGADLSPVCAVLGGHVAQDAINVLSGKEQPLQNLLLFDGDDTVGQVLAIGAGRLLGLPPPLPLSEQQQPQQQQPVNGTNGTTGMPNNGDAVVL